jgi:hypothetical protein
MQYTSIKLQMNFFIVLNYYFLVFLDRFDVLVL